MLKSAKSYEEACRTFRWRIPDRYNMAFDICDRQTMAGADGHRTALIVESADGTVERYTFHVLRLLSNRLANVLSASGIGKGDRVLVSFGPSVEAVVALLAALKMGAILVPAPTNLGELPLAWRLADSAAAAAITDANGAARMVVAREGAPGLGTILVADGQPSGCTEMWAAMEAASDHFTPVVTAADEPAILFYPDHACGKPSGVLHAHRALPGNLPPVELALGFFPQFGDIFWTPAEWMGFEGLMWALLPAWHHGVPVVAGPPGQSPEQQLALMGRHGVRAVFIPPARLLALAEAAANAPHPIPRAIATGPSPLAAAEHDLVCRMFGTHAHEIWGVMETGAVAANNAALMELRPNSPGRAAPGVTVEPVDIQGRPVRAGERGALSLAPGAPGAFLAHWNNPVPARSRLPSGWLMTGQLGSRDLDGYLWPEPLALPEGVVNIEGMPVALDEVQAALAWHPKVAEAAVLVIDGELKAFVVAAPGQSGDLALARELQALVAGRRAGHEVPRRLEFVDALPLGEDGTVTPETLVNRPIRLDAPSPEDRW